MKDIIENVTIISKNGLREICDAISITKKGIYTGEIKTINKDSEKFVNHSFIPKDQIQKIMFLNEKSRDIDFRNIHKEEKK